MPGTGLAPRMLFGITDRRLLLWAARRPRGSRWMPGALLAAIPLELIQAAGLRPGGRHWSILQLSLAGRAGLPVAVPAREAERLAGLPASEAGRAGDTMASQSCRVRANCEWQVVQ